MKKIIGIFVTIILGMTTFIACDPVEIRNDPGGEVSQADIDKLVSVTVEQRNGVNSNYLLLKSEGLHALTSFEYQTGTYRGVNGRVMAYVAPGNYTVKANILNPNGSLVVKEFPVKIDECFDLDPAWDLFWGTGTKIWSWDDKASLVWGNGGFNGNKAPAWWGVSINDAGGQVPGEGKGATMSFGKGAVLIKNRTDGTSEKGVFILDMTKKLGTWSIGNMTTIGTTVLLGTKRNANSFYIIQITKDQMVLAHAPAGTGDWGEAYFWMFRAQ